ncbi:MAG: 16S rRNA (guanine(966)-N(2))-methyltransferase RsmD [Myxococcota bacterium]
MRIIAGRLRGRMLGPVPKGVRPTTDRVRESLFSVLGSVEGMRVLDLCAGTGALGIEACSRGAEAVVWIERSKPVARALAARLADLGIASDADHLLIVSDALDVLRRWRDGGQAVFDLVFFDPPYESEQRDVILAALFGSAVVGPETMVVVEGARRHPLPAIAGARVVDERRYGDTVLTWLARARADGGS